MRILLILLFSILFTNCSFDKKSGIWKSEGIISKKEIESLKEFKTLSALDQTFKKISKIDNNFQFNLYNPIESSKWNDIYYDLTNNFKNFKYDEKNEIIFKSKKLSKYRIKDPILFQDNHIISSDQKGNLIVFSIKENKIRHKFNFYKKNFKNFEKKLNIIIENEVIFVSDNIGYLYALDYEKNQLLWAKNYKIPFRSNLKIVGNKLIAANQNNDLYFFDKNSGDILKMIPTEESTVKNEFVNNISSNLKYTIFLNTYGSLYGIDNTSMRIIWFLNLNQSLDLNPSNLFLGSQVIQDKNVSVITSNQFTYIIDSNSGKIKLKKNFASKIKPIIINDYLFSVSNTNLLIATELKNGKIIYSYDIDKKIANYLDTKKRKSDIKDIMIVNNKIMLFLKNSYVLKFSIKGNLDELYKLPSKISSNPMIVNGSLIYLDFKNKISIIN